MQGFSSRRDGSSLSTMWLSRLQVPLVSHAILVVMSRTFKKVDYAQALDLTVRLGDCLPPEHLARFVVDSVALLDLSALYAHYGSRGGEPYAPEVLLGLLFYGYATGVFSSRKIERATYEAVPFRFIAGNQHPDHDTLATFRRTFLPELKDLFVQVLLLAQEAGVLKLGTISLDGTKIHADASKHNAVSYKRLLELETQLRAEIEELFRLSEQSDQYNFTDPQSRIMKNPTDAAFEQDYNAQVAVDQGSLLIVGWALSNHPNDSQEAEPTLAAIPSVIGIPKAAALDAGYSGPATLTACEKRCIEPYIATGRDPHHASWQQRFAPLFDPPPEEASSQVKMAYKLRTALGKAIYGARKCTVEPVIGIIKEVLGFRQFSLRGELAAAGEWCLVCLAFNLKRFHTLFWA